MAPAKMLLLPALFVSLLLLMVRSNCKVEPTSTTPAISQASSTLCGTTPGLVQYRRIQCPKFPMPTVCMPDDTFCSSGVNPDSEYLCGGSGVICKKPNAGRPESCRFCPAIMERLQDTSQTIREALHEWWLEYENTILAMVFVIFCVCDCLGVWYILAIVFGMRESLLVPHYAASPTFPITVNVQVFSLNELKTITNNFRRRIGSGGFRKFFWGQLSDNRQVAVKRGNTRFSPSLEKAFRTEVEILSKARHENVVDLIGYCTENNERSLVYEFMSRKDLYRHLHPGFWQKKSMLFYSWKLRVKVLLDVAKGIEYLHKNADPRIIQRDIRTENILIDENWVAKISGFGIAVFVPELSDYMEVMVPSGTTGDSDQEYNANMLHATPWSDVYSFGMVMLEVVTGRQAKPGLEISLSRSIRSGNLRDELDKRLAVPVGREFDAVTRVALLASFCVMIPGVDKPDMNVVSNELQRVLAMFDP